MIKTLTKTSNLHNPIYTSENDLIRVLLTSDGNTSHTTLYREEYFRESGHILILFSLLSDLKNSSCLKRCVNYYFYYNLYLILNIPLGPGSTRILKLSWMSAVEYVTSCPRVP